MPADDLAARVRALLDLLAAPSGQAETAFSELAHAEVRMAFLGREVQGAAAVLQELRGIARTAAAAGFAWTVREAGGKTLLVADSPREHPQRGYVLTLQAEGGRLLRIGHQRTAPKPEPAAPLVIGAELREMIDHALAQQHPILLAHVDADGQPALSFRGSVHVHGDDRLALWVRNGDGGFLRAIAKQPRVALMYRNEATKATYQMKGRARVVDDPAERSAIYAASPQVERDHDFAEAGVAVVIDLDSVEGYAGLGAGGQVGRVRMLRALPA